MIKPVKMVCPVCGSEDVGRDGLLAWCSISQAWEMSGELDTFFCNSDVCDGAEMKEVNEIELTSAEIAENNGGL